MNRVDLCDESGFLLLDDEASNYLVWADAEAATNPLVAKDN